MCRNLYKYVCLRFALLSESSVLSSLAFVALAVFMPSPSISHTTCQVIPGKNESQWTRIATNSFKKGSGIPSLCWSHRQEYCQQYKAYKGSSRVSEALSEKVWTLLQIIDWTCPIAVAMKRAENALAATRQCIVALDTEICEREAHHKRFLTQGEYLLRAIRSACSRLRWAYTHIGFRPVHPGHENWIYVLRKRRERVEDGAEKLRLQAMIAIEAHQQKRKPHVW